MWKTTVEGMTQGGKHERRTPPTPLIQQGPPFDFTDFFFLVFRVFDAHLPIISEYGHYPYRNEAQGRDTMGKEKKYLKLTNDFGKPQLSAMEVDKIRKQKEAGVWEKLPDKGPW